MVVTLVSGSAVVVTIGKKKKEKHNTLKTGQIPSTLEEAKGACALITLAFAPHHSDLLFLTNTVFFYIVLVLFHLQPTNSSKPRQVTIWQRASAA